MFAHALLLKVNHLASESQINLLYYSAGCVISLLSLKMFTLHTGLKPDYLFR